jgi:hypothetical protein
VASAAWMCRALRVRARWVTAHHARCVSKVGPSAEAATRAAANECPPSGENPHAPVGWTFSQQRMGHAATSRGEPPVPRARGWPAAEGGRRSPWAETFEGSPQAEFRADRAPLLRKADASRLSLLHGSTSPPRPRRTRRRRRAARGSSVPFAQGLSRRPITPHPSKPKPPDNARLAERYWKLLPLPTSTLHACLRMMLTGVGVWGHRGFLPSLWNRRVGGARSNARTPVPVLRAAHSCYFPPAW